MRLVGKAQPSSVVFPVPMKRLLVACFNEIQHVSPEGAMLRLKALPQHRLDVFVEFMLTPVRVMRHFTTLNQHRKDNKIGSREPVPLSIADSAADASEYKGIKDKKKLAEEIVRRGISILPKSKLCKKTFPREILIQMLVDDDGPDEENDGFEEEDFGDRLGAFYNSVGVLDNDDDDPDSDSDGEDEEDGDDFLDLFAEQH